MHRVAWAKIQCYTSFYFRISKPTLFFGFLALKNIELALCGNQTDISVSVSLLVCGGGEVPTTAESTTSMRLSVDKLDDQDVAKSEADVVTDLDDQEQENIDIEEVRMRVDEMVLSLEMKPSKILQRRMMRFDLKLEQAVGRMAYLGCIEECDEPDEMTVNLSVAENSREILAQRNVTIMIQTENKNVTRTSDNNCEKCERIESPSTVKLSLAEESHDSLAPEPRSQKELAPMTMRLCEKWPTPDIRLSVAEDIDDLNEKGERQNSELGLSVALKLTENECLQETVGLTGIGVETVSRLSVPRVNYQKGKVEYAENVNTSVAWLSEEEIDVDKRIEKMLNIDQSVAKHRLRVNKLASMVAECGGEIVKIKDELSENAWASQQLGENDQPIPCTTSYHNRQQPPITCTTRNENHQQPHSPRTTNNYHKQPPSTNTTNYNNQHTFNTTNYQQPTKPSTTSNHHHQQPPIPIRLDLHGNFKDPCLSLVSTNQNTGF